MSDVDIVYSADVAMQLMSERISQLEHDNAILRASVMYYQEMAAKQDGVSDARIHQS